MKKKKLKLKFSQIKFGKLILWCRICEFCECYRKNAANASDARFSRRTTTQKAQISSRGCQFRDVFFFRCWPAGRWSLWEGPGRCCGTRRGASEKKHHGNHNFNRDKMQPWAGCSLPFCRYSNILNPNLMTRLFSRITERPVVIMV